MVRKYDETIYCHTVLTYSNCCNVQHAASGKKEDVVGLPGTGINQPGGVKSQARVFTNFGEAESRVVSFGHLCFCQSSPPSDELKVCLLKVCRAAVPATLLFGKQTVCLCTRLLRPYEAQLRCPLALCHAGV